ncbi:carbon-nitrogen hydrolase family protein [Amaricoccus sp.]|uniref:carbon-nitrogen hydrolase family protein n=1 Tax=Amaricoccus sp. TaxID=1872485 RepID=UPI001B79DFDA|nr:carbon-nitrogen hydrolase family protein [Amaricoccus sp.]MBP7243004.1 carbon-nitrogen hydrolase family protein [Amaricoccus sp.]
MRPFAIGGIQMYVGMQNNIDAIRQRLDVMMHLYPWVQMVVLSELAAHGPAAHSAQPAGGAFEQDFQEMARRHRIWLVPGSLFEKRDGAIYNMTPVIDPSGDVVARYRKIFPFTPYEEASAAGDEFCVFDVPEVGRFGVSICYDMWFPELQRQMTSMGAEVILNPVMANFVDRPADLAIVQASAAMFQCYVVSVNGLGVGGNGQSMIVDPAGRVLHQAGSHEAFLPYEIDLDVVRRQRERGLLGLGQPLKSFRDRPVEFPVYARDFDRRYLDSLGTLEKPRREATVVNLPPRAAE